MRTIPQSPAATAPFTQGGHRLCKIQQHAERTARTNGAGKCPFCTPICTIVSLAVQKESLDGSLLLQPCSFSFSPGAAIFFFSREKEKWGHKRVSLFDNRRKGNRNGHLKNLKPFSSPLRHGCAVPPPPWGEAWMRTIPQSPLATAPFTQGGHKLCKI